jgi:hypothetical protein
MKHPFHTLFYIGLSIMLFTGSFLILFLVNIKEILPSVFDKNREVVVREDVINSKPYKILSQPTIKIKPIDKVIVKETPKNTQPPVPKIEDVPNITTNITEKVVNDSVVNDSSKIR